MRHHFSRFISQSINRIPKPISHSSRVETPSRSPNLIRRFSDTVQESNSAPPERVPAIVDEISGLTLLEISDLTEVLRTKWGIENMPLMVVMTSGLAPPMPVAIGKVAEEEVEKKEDKKSFDLKLEGGFDVAARIKIIKEVRAVTDLGLKEAKDLVEKAPTLLKKGVTKEEAEKIIAKMKEVGAKVTME